MAKVTRKEWYRRVNASWPDVVPPLTADEAVRSAKRLYRFAMGKTWTGPVEVTSGNRYTWIRRGVLTVNPDRGWQAHVHLLSHYCHDRLHPEVHGHNSAHARAEMRMIKEVVRRGWLEGALKTEPKPERVATPIDARREKLERTLAAIKRWETKAKRAATALKKLQRRRRALERLVAAPPPQQQELAA